MALLQLRPIGTELQVNRGLASAPGSTFVYSDAGFKAYWLKMLSGFGGLTPPPAMPEAPVSETATWKGDVDFPLLFDLLRYRFNLAILFATLEDEFRSERDPEYRRRKDLQCLDEERDGDRIVSRDAELFRRQRVDELEKADIPRRRAHDQANVDSQ